jgi:tRNA pseudouridine55 synthase
LILLFGEATKLSNYLTQQAKSYQALLRLGRSTDSADALGATLEQAEVRPDWQQRLEPVLESERRRTLQLPPKLSAIKVGGRPAHRRVRAGQAPSLAERAVRVHQLSVLELGQTSLSVRLQVSKGSYVRSFARDVGEGLAVPAHLEALRRLSSGAYTLEQAVAWPPPSPVPLLSTRDAALSCLPSRSLTEAGAARCRQGKPLGDADFREPPLADAKVQVWVDEPGELVALGRQLDPGSYRVVRGFRYAAQPTDAPT